MLDLEETAIARWDDPIMLDENIDAISACIFNTVEQYKKQFDSVMFRIGIFSFAIWNEKDKEVFINTLQKTIETKLGFNISPSLILTISDIHTSCIDKKIKADMLDFFDFFGKDDAFFKWAKKQKEEVFVLFDDTIEDQCLVVNNKSIYTKNINKLVEMKRPLI